MTGRDHAPQLLERGVADRDGIDRAMVGGCGFPLGPIALLDLVGLDTSVAILDTLHAEHGDPGCVAAPRIATARAFAEACGKETVRVRDEAGSVVNALLFPYLNSAVRPQHDLEARPPHRLGDAGTHDPGAEDAHPLDDHEREPTRR